MPLDVVRLRDSDLAAIKDAEVFRAAVLSWCAAWHQTPAGSLPDDDAVLARLLGYGRDIKGWMKLRLAGALRGYVKCSDGRLYHPVVAEKAVEAWERKCAQRNRTEAARRERERQRLLREQSQGCETSVTENVTESKGREGKGREVKTPMSEPPAQPSILDCPQEAILEAFRRHLPMLTQPRVWDGNRADLLRNRWRYCSRPNGIGKGYDSQDRGIAFWDEFFAYVAQSKTLTEGIPRKEGGGNWKPDLPWLLKAENFAKVVEGKYHE
jgi:hypothetical protein